MQPDPRVGPVQPLSRTASVALRYWNIARQRQYRPSARCCRALRVSADHALRRRPAHPRKPRAFPRAEEKPAETRTVCWRELDSKFQFRATFGGLAGLRDTRPAPRSGSYRSPFRLAAGGSGFELRLTGFGPRLRRLSAGLKVLAFR